MGRGWGLKQELGQVMGGEGVIFLELEAMGRGSSPRRRREAQSSTPRTASWWDGKPGRMPPRMGAAQRAPQPERLRYRAAMKGQRVADGFPESSGQCIFSRR